MASPDTSDVDAAVLAVLTGDVQLRALLPDGVWFDMAGPINVTRYCLVSQMAHEDQDELQTVAWERVLYLVKAVVLDTSGADVKAAAYRIHQLLQDTRYPVNGYSLMLSSRTERVRYTELDEVTAQKWQHRGGQYAVYVSPA